MKVIKLKVSGMSCTNCALSIQKQLEKNKDISDISVNFISSEVNFTADQYDSVLQQKITKTINNLGYKVKLTDEHQHAHHDHAHDHGHTHHDGHHHASDIHGLLPFQNHLQRFLVCVILTIPFILAHTFSYNFFNDRWQFILAIPVYIIGMDFFGRSAWLSIKSGIANMNLLIVIGVNATFIFSVYEFFLSSIGLQTNNMHNEFFGTASMTITLLFLGNYLEERTLEITQKEIKKIINTQTIMANAIAYGSNGEEQIFTINSHELQVGDLVLIKSGEWVPADCKILWGSSAVNESILTGESTPVDKKEGEVLIGNSLVISGTVRAQVTAIGETSVIGNIVNLVKKAQTEKPPLQKLADRISAVFVPAVISISIIAFIINYLILSNFSESLLRSITILIIACPCAMGLATPAAISVGLARATSKGILFKNPKSLESFKKITTVLFDKTGTLTTGAFTIEGYQVLQGTEDAFKSIVASLELYSQHPLATALVQAWHQSSALVPHWQKVAEIRGLGIEAIDDDNNRYLLGSYLVAKNITTDSQHNIYLIKNNELVGTIDLKDELRPEAKAVIQQLKKQHIKTILISGDQKDKCLWVQQQLDIDEVYSEQKPDEKLAVIAKLNSQTPVAMVGDGINDAPALSKATIGIALSNASQIALQSASVVLMSKGLTNLPLALSIGKYTYQTIIQNLIWAFLYNVIAIPIAAVGLLGKFGPTYGALIMALSDVVLVINSIWLKFKKITPLIEE
ncbi:MAG: cation-translocating P-type ATPase [Phycisphaerales bacterium]|nr:cation-translocating P-type ATPase [Phycisphaerales bacterium]